MALPPGNFTFITDDSGTNFLTDDSGQFFLVTDVAPGDYIAYIFKFRDVAAAIGDPVLGSFFNPPSNIVELLVYGDLTINSVTPNTGYWCRLILQGLMPGLLSHPNLELVIDIQLRKVLSTAIPTTNIGIVVSNFDNFVANGIQ